MDYHQDKQESINLWIWKKQAYYSLQRWRDMKTILTQTYFWEASIMEIIELQFHLKRRLEVFPLDIFAPLTWNEASEYFHGPTVPCRQSATLDTSVLSFTPAERVTEPKSTGCPLCGCKGNKRKTIFQTATSAGPVVGAQKWTMERKGYCPLQGWKTTPGF